MTALGRQFGALVLSLVLLASALVVFVGPVAADCWFDDDEQLVCQDPYGDDDGYSDDDGESGSDGDDGASSRADFEVVSEDIEGMHVLVGEEATIDVTVENVGDRDGKYTARLQADFENVGRERVEIEAGDQYTFSFVVVFAEADSYNVYLSHDHVGKVYVYETAEDRDAALVETDEN